MLGDDYGMMRHVVEKERRQKKRKLLHQLQIIQVVAQVHTHNDLHILQVIVQVVVITVVQEVINVLLMFGINDQEVDVIIITEVVKYMILLKNVVNNLKNIFS